MTNPYLALRIAAIMSESTLNKSPRDKEDDRESLPLILYSVMKQFGLAEFIFIIGYLFILTQCLLLWVYFDDYGALSLSYNMNIQGVSGHTYTFAQLVEALKVYYHTTGGRISTCFVQLFLGMYGFRFMTICQSFVIISLLYTIYRLTLYAIDKKRSAFCALMVLIQYGLISIEINRHGLYWIGASILYVWNLLPYFLLMYILITKCSKTNFPNIRHKSLLLVTVAVLSLLSGMSHELIGAGAICSVMTFVLLEYGYKELKYLTITLTALLPAFAGYLILFTAPGNFVRVSSVSEFYQKNIPDKIVYNVPRIFDVLIQPFQSHYLIFWAFLAIYIAIALMSTYNFNRYYGGIWIVVSVGVISIYSGLTPINSAITLPYMIGFFALYGGFICYYFIITNRPLFISILVFGIASEAVLVMSYTVIERTTYPFIFSMIVTSGIISADWFYKKGKQLYGLHIFAVILIFIVGALSFINTINVLNGYLDNYYINKLNDERLTSFSDQLQRDHSLNQIMLYKLPNPLYASLMPYLSSQQTELWMKKYYNIPGFVEFQWLGLEDVQYTMIKKLKIVSVYPSTIDFKSYVNTNIGIGVVPNISISGNSLAIIINGKECQTYYGKDFVSAFLPAEAFSGGTIEVLLKNYSNKQVSEPFVIPLINYPAKSDSLIR